MTKDELLSALVKAAGNGDTEAAHIEADDALIQFINDEEIKTAYEALNKWYA